MSKTGKIAVLFFTLYLSTSPIFSAPVQSNVNQKIKEQVKST